MSSQFTGLLRQKTYMAADHFVTWSDWRELIQEVVGYPIDAVTLTTGELRTIARDLDAVRATGTPVDVALTEEAAIVMTNGRPCDDSATEAELAITFRPLGDTVADCVEYPRSVGRAGDESSSR